MSEGLVCLLFLNVLEKGEDLGVGGFAEIYDGRSIRVIEECAAAANFGMKGFYTKEIGMEENATALGETVGCEP